MRDQIDIERLQAEIKRSYKLPDTDEIRFEAPSEGEFSFLLVSDLTGSEIDHIRHDIDVLFPYRGKRSLSFSLIGGGRDDIFLIDSLPTSSYQPLSSYRIYQYDEWLREELELLRSDESDLSVLSPLFHLTIEKLQLLDLLNGESSIRKRHLRFHESHLLVGDERTDELYFDYLRIIKKTLKNHIERLGIVAIGDYKDLMTLRLN